MVKVKWFGTLKEKKAGVLEDGYGTFNWPSGSTYIGEWKYGKAEGFGVFNWSNGEKFVGEHIDGKANGYGIIFDADGYKYVGEFKDKKEKDWDYILYRVDQNILVNGKMGKKLGME